MEFKEVIDTAFRDVCQGTLWTPLAPKLLEKFQAGFEYDENLGYCLEELIPLALPELRNMPYSDIFKKSGLGILTCVLYSRIGWDWVYAEEWDREYIPNWIERMIYILEVQESYLYTDQELEEVLNG